MLPYTGRTRAAVGNSAARACFCCCCCCCEHALPFGQHCHDARERRRGVGTLKQTRRGEATGGWTRTAAAWQWTNPLRLVFLLSVSRRHRQAMNAVSGVRVRGTPMNHYDVKFDLRPIASLHLRHHDIAVADRTVHGVPHELLHKLQQRHTLLFRSHLNALLFFSVSIFTPPHYNTTPP